MLIQFFFKIHNLVLQTNLLLIFSSDKMIEVYQMHLSALGLIYRL